MNKLIILCYVIVGCALAAQPTFGQWKKIFDMGVSNVWPDGDQVYCVYFLDLPGPPRIGFVGGGDIWKTTDGGSFWSKSYDAYLYSSGGGVCNDIVFKDSLTGWAASAGRTDGIGCLKTTDGGNTWAPLQVEASSYAIAYSSTSGRLFLGAFEDSSALVSTDEGNTWEFLPFLNGAGFAFSTPLDGIVMTNPAYNEAGDYWVDSLCHVYVTRDGGVTWNEGLAPQTGIDQPLAIPGTPVYFGAAAEGPIYRSNDYGESWTLIDSSFLSLGTGGVIRGDLSKLYIQTRVVFSVDSGMYYSTDSGLTWVHDEGSPSYYGSKFYRGKGVTIVGRQYFDQGVINLDGLWEEDTAEAAVEQQQPANELMVFPNPATNAIQVSPGTGEISILDPLGRTYELPRTGNSLDISSLPSGVYFVIAGNGRTKFVKE